MLYPQWLNFAPDLRATNTREPSGRREERFAFTRDNNSCYEDRDVGRNEKQFYSFQSVPDVLSLKPSSLTEREEELSRGFHQYKKGDY
ncbi:hypothetical protein OUZ56_028131 [Daphnia magna]|uniref:Uncharacterized protein n=1 Tax=Daphnia magna TaxID=35525 RepID=A0ABR0B331_9CRUS|nr:hypothetical protein OUZ56_028131 [Daphnia magna]